MKKLCLVVLLVVSAALPLSAQKSIFYGGSGHLMAQNSVATNVFIGWQINQKMALIGNYYADNVVSVDFLYNGFVISKGFSLKMEKNKEFLTILKTPKVYATGKWKIFAKIGVNFGGPIDKIHYSKISTLFGFGLRWN